MAKPARSHRLPRRSPVAVPQEVTEQEIDVWWTESAKADRVEKPVRTLGDLCIGAVFPRQERKRVAAHAGV